MTLPTFVVAGAAKCGTTALWHLLEAHPEIGMGSIKEPRYFTDHQSALERGALDDGPPRSGTWSRGEDWYGSLFAHAAGCRAVGEASTVYFVTHDSAARMNARLPDLRVILMVRDPVARMYSHYWQERRAGWDFGSFESLISSEHPRARYFARTSSYAQHLARFEAVFSRDRLLVLCQEDLDTRPAEVLARVYAFLGVDAGVLPGTLGVRANAQRLPQSASFARAVERVRAVASPVLPDSVRRSLGRAARVVLRRQSIANPYTPLSADLRAQLVERFEDDISYVETWTGTLRPAWRMAE